MENPVFNDDILKRFGGIGWVDHPELVKYDGTLEDLLNNGYITFEEFIERIKKFIPSNDK